MYESIRPYLQYLPKKDMNLAITLYKEKNIELLKELIDESVSKVFSSLKKYGEHSKYSYIDKANLITLQHKVNTYYYDYTDEIYEGDLDKDLDIENYD